MTEQLDNALMDMARRPIALDEYLQREEIEHKLIGIYGELAKQVGFSTASYLFKKHGLIEDAHREHTAEDLTEAEAILHGVMAGVE